MSVHAISFQLTQKPDYYKDFFASIKAFASYQQVHETLWLVALPDNRENDDVYGFLQSKIHNDDFLVVIKLNGEHLKTIQGWVKSEVWNWIRGQVL